MESPTSTGFCLNVAEVSPDSDIQAAVKIANRFMRTTLFRGTFNLLFGIGLEQTAALMGQVKVKYDNYVHWCRRNNSPCRQVHTAAWIERSTGSANLTIFINEVQEARLSLLENQAAEDSANDSEERMAIVLYMSVCIVHQLGHLFNRWTGIDESGDNKFLIFGSSKPEAGQFLEVKLFDFPIEALVKRQEHSGMRAWTADTDIIGLAKGCYPIKTQCIKRLYCMCLHGTPATNIDWLVLEMEKEPFDADSLFVVAKCADEETPVQDKGKSKYLMMNTCGLSTPRRNLDAPKVYYRSSRNSSKATSAGGGNGLTPNDEFFCAII